MKQNINRSLDSVYEFMSFVYEDNWQYRWGKVPWMRNAKKAGKKESILAHEWSCIGFWFLLKDVCPSLAALVRTDEIYERLWSHDLGETFIGDISQFVQLAGKHDNKYVFERKEVERMSNALSKKTAQRLLAYFDDFETEVEKIENLETLIAKVIDAMQGNHFGLVFGDRFVEHREKIGQIVGRTFVRRSARLLGVLRARGHRKACREVERLIEHHLKHYEKLGIKIDTTPYSK